MKKTYYIALLLVEFVLCACSNSESVHDTRPPVEYLDTLSLKDMVLIRSKGQTVTLGTDDESAPVNERPAMKVSFDYDFLIGIHEVSCEEMNLVCDAADLPATNVTFFDAVLFANKRSLAEGFDTAYSYTKAIFDATGSCIGLERFNFNPKKNAYRLPTEAEWAYAASLDWAPEQSWNNVNSEYNLHPVCTAKIDTNGICDLAGNAMEWVGDFLVPFVNSPVNDFMGGKNSAGMEERVLKGGSYRNDPALIHLHSRGDVYMVTSSTKAPYVGFRLAFGAIPAPIYLDANGRSVEGGNTLLTIENELRTFVGKPLTKLVFRDDFNGNLVYVDFRAAKPSMQELDLGVSAYHPEISPNGKYIAFCTGLEGVPGESDVYVKGLDENADVFVKLSAKSAAIPRWRILENGDTAIVYVTDAGNNKDDANFLSQETWQVRFSNGKFGEPEKLFEGAYHGGVADDNNLAVTGARLLRARVHGKNEIWYNGEQACNVSLSRGDANLTLFLDFGGKTGHEFVGASYVTHERALVADSTGKLIASVAAPEGYTFDHTEWVSFSDSFFVATLTNAKGSHQKIVLTNTYTGEMLPLVEGEELWHPSLWTHDRKVDTQWDNDSLGLYYTENGQATHYLSQKMPVLWKYRDSAEVVCLGNSHIQAGVAPAHLSFFAINIATVPCDMHCIEYLYETYISTQVSHLKYLVIGIDFDLWNEFEPGESIQLNMGDAPGFQYDIHHDYWREGVDNAFVERTIEIASAYEVYASIRDERGWMMQTCIEDWGSEGRGFAEVLVDSTWKDDSHRYEQNYAQLDNILKIAELHGVKVVGLILPLSPYYRNTGSYGRHGMRRSVAEQLIERLKKVAAESENFVLMDENKMGNHDYLGDVANDYDHLCDVGAKKLTLRLDSLLKTLENQ
ncbi:MAG: TIGR02171 family protein [Fibrobacter sp.]|nr:TIGR02171 family protein [Fibrobacter sp.]